MGRGTGKMGGRGSAEPKTAVSGEWRIANSEQQIGNPILQSPAVKVTICPVLAAVLRACSTSIARKPSSPVAMSTLSP
ncbi:MAG: hypothetical protein OGMRLDGQ_001629 [Candidatus Fervidibacter sp.]